MYSFKAKVMAGQGRGQRIGFRTANLDKLDLKIAYGVYLVRVKIGRKFFSGLMHYGPRKTFEGSITCEVFIKDFNEEIYGQEMSVEVMKKIREVKKFNSTEELKKQLEEDFKRLEKLE